MKMHRINVHLPRELKSKLDRLRRQGYSASAYIRRLVERDLGRPTRRRRRKEEPHG